MDSGGLFPDIYDPPHKRLRIHDPNFLPDECLYEILRRLPGAQSRSASACVSNRWLTILSNIRNSETLFDKVKVKVKVNADVENGYLEHENDGYLTRCLEGKKATDTRLAAIAVGTSARGGLGRLSVRGSDKITSLGFSAIARGCPNLRVLELWNVSSIGDKALVEISKECHMLQKLDLSHCPLISNKGISVIAQNCPNLSSLAIESCENVGNESLRAVAKCCPNLQSISIKDCPFVGDQGVATLLWSASLILKKLKLQALNITDFSLAVIGHYGKSITNLALAGLGNVSEKGFWAMGTAKGFESLTSLTVISCFGVTDLSLDAIGNGCRVLKHLSLKNCRFITDKGLVSFAESASCLEILQLEECSRISEKAILGALTNPKSKLKSLSIIKCMNIKDLAQERVDFLQCQSLRSLTIKNCIGFGNTNLKIVLKLCPFLRNLDLSGICGITDVGLVPLLESYKSGLVKVNLSGCLNLTDKVVVDLVSVHGGTLESINLEGCRRITDGSLAAIGKHCRLVNNLDVSRCCITDCGVLWLARGELVNLRVLSLSGCGEVSDKSVPCLKKLGKTLLGLNLQRCGSISRSMVESLVEKLWWCDIIS